MAAATNPFGLVCRSNLAALALALALLDGVRNPFGQLSCELGL